MDKLINESKTVSSKGSAKSSVSSFKDFLTWMPVIFFPGSHMVQIHKMLREGSAAGVSAATFAGYFFGNMGAFLFAEKYTDIRTLLSFVLTAILEVIIVSMVAYYNGNTHIMKIVIITAVLVGAGVLTLILTSQKWVKRHADAAGVIPAIAFPGASLFQFKAILDQSDIHGVSCTGWMMQVLANLGAYLLVDKPNSVQNVLAFLGTAIIDVVIIIVILKKGGKCTVSLKSIFS
jgi:hypothetical protein